MKIFYDGLNIEKYASNTEISGFTTNCTFFSTNDVKNYRDFYEKNKHYLKGRCISFQVWLDDDEGIQQINEIYELTKDAPEIYVKIPIIDSNGSYNGHLIRYAIYKNMRINITAVYTTKQIILVYDLLEKYNQPCIVSIFAGPISDTGKDPNPSVSLLKILFEDNPYIEILWAGCRELYTIARAEKSGCNIITVPGDIIDKMNLLDKDLDLLAFDRVNKFKNDAINGNISIL